MAGAHYKRGDDRRPGRRWSGTHVPDARLFTILLLLISCCDALWGQSRKPTEFEVKAAYLYNFGKFVRWPSAGGNTGEDSFLICVLGQDPFGSALDTTVQGESLDGKHLKIQRVDSAAQAGRCRILFISNSEQRHLDSILLELGKHPVLTVSDIQDFADRGGDIEFVNQGDKIRFKVNLTSAEKAGLALSSELLKVAVAVKRDGQSGE